MLPTKQTMERYNIVVKNKPGELAKLTKFLADLNISLNTMQVADLGTSAAIQFETRTECMLRNGLHKLATRD